MVFVEQHLALPRAVINDNALGRTAVATPGLLSILQAPMKSLARWSGVMGELIGITYYYWSDAMLQCPVIVHCNALMEWLVGSVVQCRAVQCRVVQCSVVQCSVVYSAAYINQCSAVQCRTLQCSVVQNIEVQCSEVQQCVQCCSVPKQSAPVGDIGKPSPDLQQHCALTTNTTEHSLN